MQLDPREETSRSDLSLHVGTGLVCYCGLKIKVFDLSSAAGVECETEGNVGQMMER